MSASPSMPSASSSSNLLGSISLETKVGHKKISPSLWLPLSPFPSYEFDVEEDPVEVSGRALCSALNSPTSLTPTWMHPHQDIDLSMDELKSEFEDWDDPIPPNSAVIMEEDGAQTLLIPYDSQFYIPPPPPPAFGFAPSSDFYADHDIAASVVDEYEDDPESSPDALLTPQPFHSNEPAETPTRKSLFVDTTHPAVVNPPSGFVLSSSLFYSPDMGDAENPAWAPSHHHGYMYDGPDVPLDCIYSAGDISPVDRWDEKLWSPVVLQPLRTAPCI
ncbi:hypothetical protein CPC08DRAFT_445448 [Agrocybe pediades]|nr:hypothetical protein CPC08DRAFT_445448 [Agrocybe pediades]